MAPLFQYPWIISIRGFLWYHLNHLCGFVIKFLMFLHNYYCILLGYTSALQYRYFALPIWVSYISFIQSVNGVQFLNVVCLFLFPVCFASSSAPAPAIFMVPFTRMYASLLPQRLELSIRVLNLIWLFVMRLPIHHRLLQPNYFCAEFRWLMICVVNQIYDFLILCPCYTYL